MRNEDFMRLAIELAVENIKHLVSLKHISFVSWFFSGIFLLCQITRGVWHSVHPTVQGHHYYVVISKIVSAHRTEGKILWPL